MSESFLRRYVWLAAVFSAVLAQTTLGLDWEQGVHFRSAAVQPAGSGRPGFTRLTPEQTGIHFTNTLSRAHYTTNQIYLNGSGVAAGDIDGDGWCDLYFCGLDGNNVLYRNLGNWKFEDITERAGVACPNLYATGAVFADIDGDGALDLIVNSVGGGTHVFLNDGKGHFHESAVLNQGKGGMSLALADVDGDGYLDLYIANYRVSTIRDQPNTRIQGEYVKGKPVVKSVNGRPATDPDLIGRFTLQANGKIIEHGEADAFYRNDGKGNFKAVSFTDGTFLDEDGKPLASPLYDWGLSVMFRDLNGDGAPDLYVCNDFSSEDRIWLNQGDGHFRAIPRLALRHTSMFSMGIDFADIDRDGYDDFFVADMLSRSHRKRNVQMGDLMPVYLPMGVIDNRPQYSFNTLFHNRRDGTYAEIAHLSGLEASEWTWAPLFLDVDLDGFEDLLVTTGHERDARNIDIINKAEALKAQRAMTAPELLELNNLFERLDTPNLAFRNRGNLTFEEKSKDWGFDARGVSHGMALADLDNDGDMDVVMNNLNEGAGIYRNDGGGARVGVRLKGAGGNTRGIGAKMVVRGGAVAMQSQEMISGGRYLSGDDAMRVFAAGSLTNVMSLEVRWRSGKRSVVEGVRGNRIYEVEEPAVDGRGSTVDPALSTVDGRRSTAGPIFEDVSSLLGGHEHHEEEYDDFERQPLLPEKLSRLGPGVSWHDLDGDGLEDLIIGSGRGGKMAVYYNDGKGGFRKAEGAPVNRELNRDQTAILGMGNLILAGSSNYEDGQTNGGCLRIYDFKRKVSGESILGQGFSVGPLALGDVDGDGDLDLFVGGRVMPGRYPQSADSLLMRNDGGRLVLWQRFEKLGMVSGAVFSDLNGDGTPELVVACDWGGVRVFQWNGGKYEEKTKEYGLSGYEGRWSGIGVGDFDGDGRMDLVVGNWGLNSRYQASREHPWKMYWGDYSGEGRVDMIEAQWDEEEKKEVPLRNLKIVSGALPLVMEKARSFEEYGRLSVEELYGDRLKEGGMVEVRELRTMVFMNRGGKFEGKEVGWQGQVSPVYGVNVGDMNGDGKEDLFLSQNFFAVNPEDARQDAGRGIWMEGDGRGGFRAVEGQESGVKVYGEGRGSALCDYDGDGRVDLVVSQNGAGTKLYHNVRGKAGVRVRLKGPAGNGEGIGGMIRLRYADGKLGPGREVHGGSGYWSEDSAVQVMGKGGELKGVWVRWPGGKEMEVEVAREAREVRIGYEGKVEVLK